MREEIFSAPRFHNHPSLLLAAFVVLAALLCPAYDLGQGSTSILECALTVEDQEGRASPFFVGGAGRTRSLKAKLVLSVSEGSDTCPGATFRWLTPMGDAVVELYQTFTHVGANVFVAECTLAFNMSSFPPESEPYSASVWADTELASRDFYVCEAGERLSVYFEDFTNHTQGSFPGDWEILSPGYGQSSQWVEELIFEGNDKVLRITSYSQKDALLRRALSIPSPHLHVSFETRIWQESGDADPGRSAMAFGLETSSGQRTVSLLELGGWDNRVLLPFGTPYSFNSWIRIDIYLEMGKYMLTGSVYVDDRRVGGFALPELDPGDVGAISVLLTGGAHYVAQLDDLALRALDPEGDGPGPPADPRMTIWPSHAQWFDPSTLMVEFEVDVLPCLETNPYLAAADVHLELWNETTRLGVIGRTGWDGSARCHSPCQPFTHRYVHEVPLELLGTRLEDDHYAGDYVVRAVPSDPSLGLLYVSAAFRIDDAMRAYFSFARAGEPVLLPNFGAGDFNLSVNIEFDPSSTRTEESQPLSENICSISWLDPQGESILNETSLIGHHLSYPSDNDWAFGTLRVRRFFSAGIYTCRATVTTNSGLSMSEAFHFRIEETLILWCLSVGLCAVLRQAAQRPF